MGNAPVINMSFYSETPGADEDTVQRYYNWSVEVYQPMMMKVNGVTGIDRYILVRKSPDYPLNGVISHLKSIVDWGNSLKSPERTAIGEDLNSWVKRGVREGIWSAAYELVQNFRAGTASQRGKKDTKIENAPVMHLEAYRMPNEEQEKYNKWFNEYGSRVFIPLFMKTCGLKGYDYLKYSGFGPVNQARETEYPQYLSVLYFEDVKAFEHFQESPEQVSFQSALRNVFPFGLNYKWYVQYQLVKSWRK
jgi:heme-degrading monooxygenase HmoA